MEDSARCTHGYDADGCVPVVSNPAEQATTVCVFCIEELLCEDGEDGSILKLSEWVKPRKITVLTPAHSTEEALMRKMNKEPPYLPIAWPENAIVVVEGNEIKHPVAAADMARDIPLVGGQPPNTPYRGKKYWMAYDATIVHAMLSYVHLKKCKPERITDFMPMLDSAWLKYALRHVMSLPCPFMVRSSTPSSLSMSSAMHTERSHEAERRHLSSSQYTSCVTWSWCASNSFISEPLI